MSIIDSLKSAVSSFTGKNIANNMLKSVVYDFSMVEKARFYVFDVTDDKDETNFEGKKTGNRFKNAITPHAEYEELPVQLNPDSLDIERSFKVCRINGVMPPDYRSREGDNPVTSTFSIKYSIFDYYNIVTLDGASDDGKVSLENRELTSLKILRDEVAGKENRRVLFAWGPNKIFGKLTGFSPSYSMYSRWGTPLEADVTVEITTEPMLLAVGNEYTYDFSQSMYYASVKQDIGTGEFADKFNANNGPMKALVGFSQALR